MVRRTFLGYGLMLLGFGRRAWAQLMTEAPRYSPLSHPVRIPLESVTVPWQPVTFTAEAMAPAAATTASRRVLISGVVFRRSGVRGAGAPGSIDELSALCVTCPHEQCPVELVTDEARLAKMSGGRTLHPMFECGCHFSKFDASEEGAWVSGVAYRGLFRFRVGVVRDGTVEINEIEEEALSVV